MSAEEKKVYIRITGTNAFGQSLEKFYTGDEKAAELAFLSSPAEQGGPTSWSTEIVEELPEYVYIYCACCDKNILNTNMITEV